MGDAGVWFAVLADGGDELSILEFDAVHRDVDTRHVDRLVAARDEVVVAGDVRAGITDVAEERAERSVVVERQRQRADRAVRRLELDRHVHRDAELGIDRTLHRIGGDDRAARLVGEQVDGVGGVVPQQVVGPAARLAQRVGVGAPEEVRLHVHLLDLEFAGLDALVDPLVARVEATRVSAHRDQPGLVLAFDDRPTIGERVAQRDLDLHVLAGVEALDRLVGVHLGRGAQDHGVEPVEREALGEVGRDVLDAVLAGDILGLRRARGRPATRPRHRRSAAARRGA